MLLKNVLWKGHLTPGEEIPAQNKIQHNAELNKAREQQGEGGSSDKPDVLNLFHHLCPFLPLSLLQQLLEPSGRGEGSKKARHEQRKGEWRKEWSEEAMH